MVPIAGDADVRIADFDAIANLLLRAGTGNLALDLKFLHYSVVHALHDKTQRFTELRGFPLTVYVFLL